MTTTATPETNGAVKDTQTLVAPPRAPLMVAAQMDLADAVNEVLRTREGMKNIVIEQDEFVDACVRALVSQTHVVAMGPGGVGKTFTGDLVERGFDLTSLYTVFRNDSKREEIFGPLSMQGLAADRYEHVMGQGYLQDVELLLADEFVDAGRFTRQLLNALNERRFVNGATTHRIPLLSTIAMTNFTPSDPALDALMDRLPQRLWLDSELSSDGFKRILRDAVGRRGDKVNGTSTQAPLPITSREALGTVMHAVETCPVPDAVFEAVDELRRNADREGLVHRSPRRWQYGIALAQADAILSGRDTVSELNLRVFRLVLPNAEDEMEVAARLCKDFRDPVQTFVDSSKDVLREIEQLLAGQADRMKRNERPTGDDFAQISAAFAKLDPLDESVTKQLKTAKANGHATKPIDELKTLVADTRTFIQKASGLSA
jgi:MoxR-like ATPase